jgi:molybdenum cofactor biosynthesis protein MoaC
MYWYCDCHANEDVDNQASKLQLNPFLVPRRSRHTTQPWRVVGTHLLSSSLLSFPVRLYATNSSSNKAHASYLDGNDAPATNSSLDKDHASYLDGDDGPESLINYYLADDSPSPDDTKHEIGGSDGKGKPSVIRKRPVSPSIPSSLTHLNASGDAHMVSICSKVATSRKAIAVCSVLFSNPTALPLIRSNSMKKGDVLSVARVAGIMAAKKTSDLIPLCHPIAITHVSIDLQVVGGTAYNGDAAVKEPERVTTRAQGTGRGDTSPRHLPKSEQDHEKTGKFGKIRISATVACDGKTGVEMEALTAASTAALTVYDMCKAVDKGMRIMNLRVVRKSGGKSGNWIEGENVP